MLRNRARLYNAQVEQAMRYAEEGKALIVAPDDTCGVSTFTRDRELLRKLYDKGYGDGHKIRDFLQKLPESDG